MTAVGKIVRRAGAVSALALALGSMAGRAHAAPAPEPGLDETAQPVAEDAGDADIVVTGSIVAAQEASITAKRRADNLADIAAADAVGRYPDQNSAAALARLPAVAVQRDQGQERYIQVRGAPNRWTSVSFDGVPVIGADEGGASRAFRFDAIPAVLLSEMAINKSLTPNIQAEAIVATIDLKTYSPLSQTGFHATGDAGYGWMDLGNGPQRQGSLRLSWASDRFGIVLGGSHYRRDQVTDNREVGLYDDQAGPADLQFGPTELDIRQYRLVRENNGLFAGVEFSPAEGSRLYAKAIYSEFKDDEQRDQYEIRLDRAASGVRNLSGGDLVRVPVRGSFNLGEYRTRNYINTLGAEHKAGAWRVSAALNYTRTENTTYLPLIQASTPGAAAPSVTFDFSQPILPRVQLFRTVAGVLPGSFARGPALDGFDQTSLVNTPTSPAILLPITQDVFTDSYTAKFDISRETDALTLSAGFLAADRNIDGFTFALSNTINLASAPGAVGLSFDPARYITGRPWQTGFPLGINFTYVDNVAMRRDIDTLLATLRTAGRYDPAANVPPENRFTLGERLLAGYAMARFAFDSGQVTAGVRIENFRLASRGTARLGGGVLLPLGVVQDYTDFFPSVNARFDLGRDIVLRAAVQRGIARPSFGEVRVGAAINDTTLPGTISGGNPTLRPEYTWGADASLEYYLPGKGLIALSAFHRWVDNVLYATQRPVGSDAFDGGGVDRSGYLLTSTFNGGNGRLYGVELNYQQAFTFLPGPLDGLGFQGNVTFLGGTFDTPERRNIGFPGTSDTIVNASLYYEKHGLSVRLSYQWRDDWLETLGIGTGGGATGDEFRGAYDNLDLAIRYDISPRLGLFIDMNNLTDARYTAFQGDRSRPTEVEQIGRRYMFGVRFGL
ncbi:TonB-dependent receptor [Sphingomonas changnyeongensis]|uniref:TonB-dependent receptor n=1 Tax=Sphingomonas changnyeongensis TaxID=2698679 RepID=A0A7Z2NXG4_9SPHN|nr:TonB-dependent receptor [Sphingomonas changnyeongensis]QHL91595.1 TonB-dependent receptor [Sphingomonas changnyeongensis]